MTIWAIVPAAGIGLRMGSSTPKQYLSINGKPVLAHALGKLLQVSTIDKIAVALNPADTYWPQLLDDHLAPQRERLLTVRGGETRQQSVLNGLIGIAQQAKKDDWVLVHDAVRPCVLASDIESMLMQLSEHPIGGLLGCAVDNTLKQVGRDAQVEATLDRSVKIGRAHV